MFNKSKDAALYDVAQHEADVEEFRVVASQTFCAVGPSKVEHDGSPLLAVGERAEQSTTSDALGAYMGSKQTHM